MITVPVTVDRPIPADADITMLRITRERIAGHYRSFVSVVARLPPIPMRTSGPVVSMHLGWRARGDGSIRVAVVAGAGPVPRRLREYVVAHDGWQEIVVPAAWGETHQRIAQLRSRRDTATAVMKTQLLDWLASCSPSYAADVIETYGLEEIARWRSPRRFAALAWRWVDDPPADAEPIRAHSLAALTDGGGEGSQRAHKIRGRRTDTYANIAAWPVRKRGSSSSTPADS